MTLTAPNDPARCPDTTVQRGNAWSSGTITLPANDPDDNPITWGTFTVSSPQLEDDTITIQASGSPPVLVLSLTAAQTDAITVGWVHWYVAEDTAMGGNEFLTGRIQVTNPL